MCPNELLASVLVWSYSYFCGLYSVIGLWRPSSARIEYTALCFPAAFCFFSPHSPLPSSWIGSATVLQQGQTTLIR